MNKGITLLVLVALLGAMGLVLYSHSGSKQEAAVDAQPEPQQSAPTFADNAPASPLQAPQGDSGGLARIEPPIGASNAAPEGAPVPVTLGPDGRQPRPEPAPLPPAVPVQPKPEPKAEAKPEVKPEAKKEAPAKPAAPKPAPQADKKPAPQESKPSSGAPGLTPWASPPSQSGNASAQAPQPSVPPPPATTAEAPAPASQASSPPLPEQRMATDPIRPAQTPGSGHRLTAISLVPAGQAMRLRIEANAPFTVKTFALTGPDRLVVDLPGNWQGMKAPSLPQNNVVGKVRLGQQPSGPRLVLDLKGPLKNHRAEASGNAVEILVQ